MTTPLLTGTYNTAYPVEISTEETVTVIRSEDDYVVVHTSPRGVRTRLAQFSVDDWGRAYALRMAMATASSVLKIIDYKRAADEEDRQMEANS